VNSERINVLISGKIVSVSKERAKKMGLKETGLPRRITVIKTDFKMIK
jgi:hypothetical protein